MQSIYGSGRIKRRRFTRRLKIYCFLGGLFFLCLGIFYLIANSGLFDLRNITILNASEAERTSLIERLRPQISSSFLSGVLGVNNYFSWKSGDAYSDIGFSKITVMKNLFDRTIALVVAPREQFAIWCVEAAGIESKNCVWIDANGVAFSSAPIPDGSLVTKISVAGLTALPTIGSTVLDSDQFGVVARVIESLNEKNIYFSNLTVDRARQEFQVKILPNAITRFSLRFDPTKTALPALQKFISDPGLSRMQYLDLTTENRAYYKLR